MSDIRFECPYCGQKIEAPEKLGGTTVACPGCMERLRLPATARPMPKKKSCPDCGATNVMRCEMAYAQGTKTGKISGAMLGADFGANGSITPVIGGGSVGTQSQTIFAQMSAPPKPRMSRKVCWIIGCILLIGLPTLGLGLWYWWSHPQGEASWMVGVLIAGAIFGPALIGYIIAAALGKSADELDHERALFAWQRSWVCLMCGKIFIPADAGEKMPDGI
ncbi:MAG: hypothetical protein NTV49_05370 [Kiritimatiellaeota bacterium]|nr:hypothetical protein [Kiritimatiellota bacterium]